MPNAKYTTNEIRHYIDAQVARYKEMHTEEELEDEQAVLAALNARTLQEKSEEEEALLDEAIVFCLGDACLDVDWEAAQRRSWAKTPSARTRSDRRPRLRALRTVAMLCVTVAVIGALTLGGANAFRWDMLLRLFRPAADTIGVETPVVHDNQVPAERDQALYLKELVDLATSGKDAAVEITYGAFDEIPRFVNGKRVSLEKIPEGLAFSYGRCHETIEKTIITTVMKGHNGGEIGVQASVFRENSYGDAVLVEQDDGAETSVRIGDIDVLFSANAGYHSAVWTAGNASYFIWGETSLQTIEQIAKEMIGVV